MGRPVFYGPWPQPLGYCRPVPPMQHPPPLERIDTMSVLKSHWRVALAALVICFPHIAFADGNYPERPITITTPTAAGGGTDMVARIFAEKISPLLGQTIVVNNKPGAGGLIGNQAMQQEKNDGYSLFVSANNNQLIIPLMLKDANFDPIKDYEPIAGLARVPYILAVHPSFPAQNLAEFLSEIKSNPGKYQYVSAGIGTLNHLVPEILSERIGSKMEHVPYRGISAALTDVISNRVPIVFGALPAIFPHVEAGKLRVLAVASESRLPSLPSVPALNEEVPGMANDMWVALYAPAKTPDNIIQKINSAISIAKSDPEVAARFEQLGMSLMKDGPQELAGRQEAEFKTWKTVLRQVGITPQ